MSSDPVPTTGVLAIDAALAAVVGEGGPAEQLVELTVAHEALQAALNAPRESGE